MLHSEAERAAREQDHKIDILATKLIREQGLPLWIAIAETREMLQKRRDFAYMQPWRYR